MKRLQTFFLLLLISSSVKATSFARFNYTADPSYPTLRVTTLEPLSFYYNNAEELLSAKTINNAIKVNLDMQQQSCLVFAQVFMNDNSGNSSFANNLSLKLNSTNSADAAGAIGEKNLSQNPTLLFVQSNVSSEPKNYEFIYDLKLAPPTTVIGTTNCNFIITFTITQQ
jgi:hypothetical protein